MKLVVLDNISLIYDEAGKIKIKRLQADYILETLKKESGKPRSLLEFDQVKHITLLVTQKLTL